MLDALGCDSPLTFDRRLYALSLSDREREKQQHYANVERRENVLFANATRSRRDELNAPFVFFFCFFPIPQYVDSILDDLLPDDVRHLVLYEDELSQIGSYASYGFENNASVVRFYPFLFFRLRRFQKIFPTASSHRYHQYFDDNRYYNMLLDAWENKYSDNREDGKHQDDRSDLLHRSNRVRRVFLFSRHRRAGQFVSAECSFGCAGSRRTIGGRRAAKRFNRLNCDVVLKFCV